MIKSKFFIPKEREMISLSCLASLYKRNYEKARGLENISLNNDKKRKIRKKLQIELFSLFGI